MLRTPLVYNAVEKVWSGPAIDQRKYDIPFGELLLNELAMHGDKLIQVYNFEVKLICKNYKLRTSIEIY